MFNEITFYPILGVPFIMWGGIITFIMFLITGTLGYLTHKVKNTLSAHMIMAKLSLCFGLIHGVLGLLSLF